MSRTCVTFKRQKKSGNQSSREAVAARCGRTEIPDSWPGSSQKPPVLQAEVASENFSVLFCFVLRRATTL